MSHPMAVELLLPEESAGAQAQIPQLPIVKQQMGHREQSGRGIRAEGFGGGGSHENLGNHGEGDQCDESAGAL